METQSLIWLAIAITVAVTLIIYLWLFPSAIKEIAKSKRKQEINQFLRDAKLLLHNLPNESVYAKNPLETLPCFLTRLYPLFLRVKNLQTFADDCHQYEWQELADELEQIEKLTIIGFSRHFRKNTKFSIPNQMREVDMAQDAWMHLPEKDQRYFLDVPFGDVYVYCDEGSNSDRWNIAEALENKQELQSKMITNELSLWDCLEQVARETLSDLGKTIPRKVSHAHSLLHDV